MERGSVYQPLSSVVLVGLDGVAIGAEQLDVCTDPIGYGLEHFDAVQDGALLATATVDVIELQSAKIAEATCLTLPTKLVERTLSLLCVTLATGVSLILTQSVWVLLGTPAIYAVLAALVVAALSNTTLREARFLAAFNTGFCHGLKSTTQRTPSVI